MALLATFFSVYLATNTENNKVGSILWAVLAIALSPWKILTGLALLPCLLSLNHRQVAEKQSRVLLGTLIVSFLAILVCLLDVTAFTPTFQKNSVISPKVVENAFNLYSVFGLNLFPAESFYFQIAAVVLGIITILFVVRFQEPVQKGACMALAASLFLPGQTFAASGTALSLMVVGTLSRQIWVRPTSVLALTLFAEIYLVKRWDLYAKLFYKDWLYDPVRNITPTVIAFFLIKIFVLVSLSRQKPSTLPVVSAPRQPEKFLNFKNWAAIWTLAMQKHQVPRIEKADLVKILALVVASFVLTFYNLGAFTNPKTYISGNQTWKITLAPGQKISDIWIYKSKQSASLNVTCAQDETTQTVKFMRLEAFGWAYRKLIAPCEVGATFETSVEANGQIFEIYLADGEGKRVQPLKVCAADDASGCFKSVASLVFDEPNQAPHIPTQFHGCYYDEPFHIEDGIHATQNIAWTTNTNPAHPYLGRAAIALSMDAMGAVPFAWRFPDGLAGALLPLLVLFLGWRLFGRKNLAFFAGFLVLCDTGRLSISRVATTDSQLGFWIMVQAIGIWEWVRLSAVNQSKQQQASLKHLWLIVTGIGLGAAAGIKWSGFFALPILVTALVLNAAVAKKPIQSFLSDGLLLVVVSFVSYGIGYAIVMDTWSVSLVETIISDAFKMLRFHQDYGGYIPYQSQFVEWPWLNRPVALFAGYGLAPEKTSKLFIVGNPFLYWAILPAVYVAMSAKTENRIPGNLFTLGFFVSLFVVWGLIGRLTFLYHFVPIMPFGALIVASVLYRPEMPVWLRRTYLVLVGTGLVIFLPLALGLVVPREMLSFSDWFNEWFGLFDLHTRFTIQLEK